MNPMIRRVAATEAVMKRFNGKAFRWSSNDCVRMVALHLRKLGYRISLPRAGSYSSLKGALKALKAAGFSSVEEALDSLQLPRIPLAYALPGDILAAPGADGITALWIFIRPGRALGFHEESETATLIVPNADQVICWKADPRG